MAEIIVRNVMKLADRAAKGLETRIDMEAIERDATAKALQISPALLSQLCRLKLPKYRASVRWQSRVNAIGIDSGPSRTYEEVWLAAFALNRLYCQ